MKRIDVVKGEGEWVGKSNGRIVSRGDTKDEAIRNTASVAKADPEAVSVKIHKENGTFEEERTYPASADPHSSKG